MNNQLFKMKFLESLKGRGIWYQQVNDIQFRTRCPYCGDSSNPSTGHFYIKINLNDNTPMVYNCFRCPAKGVINVETMKMLEITDPELVSGMESFNKSSDKYDNKSITNNDIRPMFFNFDIPPQKHSEKIKYIEKRLGIPFDKKMIDESKIIFSLKEFIKYNKLEDMDYKKSMIRFLDEYYIGFLSYGNSHILFRDVTETQELRWIKFPITRESYKNRVFYSMSSSGIDVMSTEPIIINLAEGVLDILSVAYNLGHDQYKNTLNIASGGKYYTKLLFMLIDMGFIGSNITINIFSDNDKEWNTKKNNRNEDTMIGFYRNQFKNYKYYFGEMNVWYNLIGKDCGVPKDQIMLKKEVV